MRRLVAIVAVLAVSLLAAAPASAADLTAEERQRFISGTRERLGWSGAEAGAFLVEHPDLVVAVGVELRSDPEVVVVTASGKTITTSVSLYNVFGNRVWSWYMKRYFEYDGTVVTYAPRPTTWPERTTLGKAVGWEYDGVIETNGYWINCDGVHRHSCNLQFKQAKFTCCIAAPFFSETPWQEQIVFYHGGWTRTYGY